jgi:hypothetical protein
MPFQEQGGSLLRTTSTPLTALNGPECRIRTYDPLLPKQVRYQTALIPVLKTHYSHFRLVSQELNLVNPQGFEP